MRLMSASIAATPSSSLRFVPQSTPAWRQRDQRSPRLLLRALSMNAAVSARGSRTTSTTAKPRIWFSKVTRWPTQLLARAPASGAHLSLQRLHMHGFEEASASQMRQTSRVVAIGLVGGKRLERLVSLPALDADHGEAELAQPVKEDQRHSPRLEHDPTTTWHFASSFQRPPRSRLRLCSREPPCLHDRERKRASRPSEYRGQQNSPLNGLLFHFLADRIGLRRRAPAPLPDVEKLRLRRPRFVSAAAVSGAKLGLSALCDEDWRWERNELRQFPQILGSGGQ